MQQNTSSVRILLSQLPRMEVPFSKNVTLNNCSTFLFQTTCINNENVLIV